MSGVAGFGHIMGTDRQTDSKPLASPSQTFVKLSETVITKHQKQKPDVNNNRALRTSGRCTGPFLKL